MGVEDRITVLEAEDGFATAKTISLDGARSYSAGENFFVHEVPVSSIRDLSDVLSAIANPSLKMLVIRGELRPEGRFVLDTPGAAVKRRKTVFQERPRRWICLDFDGVDVGEIIDLALDPERAVRLVIELHLPEYFLSASCHWQLSSRAGLDGPSQLVKLHLWFWLDRAVSDDELAAWAESCAPEVDASLFRCVQVHYVSNPLFVGVVDPISRRFGLLEGSRDEVSIPRDFPRRSYAPSAPGGAISATRGQSYEERMARLGDGDGLGGFHDVLRDAIWAYFARGRTNVEWLKADLRRRIAAAPQGPDRLGDVDRYASDIYLDDSIDGARRKLSTESSSYGITRDRLQNFARKLVRRQDDREAEVGDALLRVAKGEAFAAPEELENLLPRMLRALAARFDRADPASLEPLFAPSLQMMPQLPAESLVFRFRGEQQRVRDEADQRSEALRARIREAFQNGRDYPYTRDELESFGPRIARRWIVQKDRSFYIFFAGIYQGPFSIEVVASAAVVLLAPAASAGVQLFRINKQGEIAAKSPAELVREYGTYAVEVEVDLNARITTFDEARRTMIEATCPLRPFEPRFHAEIDHWIRLIAVTADNYEKLKTWLARCPLLNLIASALLITGPTGIGKSLLGTALSTLWTTTGPTPLEHAFGEFNEQLARCPLTFADEKLPEDWRGLSKTAELRLHIQQRTRLYKRKFLPTAKMIGATRTLVVANNKDVLATRENLTAADVKAIVGRYLHIDVPMNYGTEVVKKYLEDLNAWEPGRVRRWVDEGWFAEHVLWLRDHHEYKECGRYGIEIEDESLTRSLLTRTGVPSAVCQWLVGYLLEPRRFEQDGRSNKFARRKDGELLVNAQALVRCWDIYVMNERCPTTGQIAIALAGLCKDGGKADGRITLPDDRKRPIKYRVVDIENLIEWAEEKGYADREELVEALKLDTPEKSMVTRLN